MLKRITSLLLCLIFAASSLLLVACDKGDDTSSTGDTSGGENEGFLNEAKKLGR